MTTEELALKEEKLIEKIGELNKKASSANSISIHSEINKSYFQIHRQYAELASNDIEALKRGLFIQWFYMTEPTYLTGVSSLDATAEKAIVDTLEELLSKNALDEELEWMLYHYTYWSYVFNRYRNYKHLEKIIETRAEKKLLKEVNIESMKNRGSMGKYWSSFQTIK